MKRTVCALMLTLIMMFAFSVTCLAAGSPTQEPITTKKQQSKQHDTSSTSPKTGMELAGAFVAIVSAAGVALVAKRKFTEAE